MPDLQGPNPSGLCMCGCGLPAPTARQTRTDRGDVHGMPVRYIRGHDSALRSRTNEYVEQDCGYKTPCWVWQKHLSPKGYAQKRVGRGPKHPAHQVFYERVHGPIPDGMQLDHLCRNRSCVNPDHLEVVTGAENVRRGLVTLLIPTEVRQIKRSLADGMAYADLAPLYGVSKSCIWDIWRGRSWRDVL